MIVAVASGKGGTGKTTLAASLAAIWPSPVAAVDLDVEAPNLHLFMKPIISARVPAFLEIPVIDNRRCTGCHACNNICQFKAIGIFGDLVMTFPEMCHGCGACWSVCPEKAITPGQRELGQVLVGRSGLVPFLMGRLRVGEAMSPPLIRAVKQHLFKEKEIPSRDVIIDAPPGVSCPAINAVMDTDIIVLVTEPTPFGLYDLTLATDAFATLGKPMGVVINRAGTGTRDIYTFCQNARLPILAEIPFQRAIAETYANGHIIAETLPALRPQFQELASRIQALIDYQPSGEMPCHA